VFAVNFYICGSEDLHPDEQSVGNTLNISFLKIPRDWFSGYGLDGSSEKMGVNPEICQSKKYGQITKEIFQI